ncbi:MAG: hypothetical protein AB7V58_08505 [Solirubrobacterales bacterium]
MRRPAKLLAALALASALALSGVAGATTGSINGYPQPKVYVPFSQAAPFEGRFLLTEVGRGANLRSGEMKIEFPEAASPKFLAGAAAFYEYNSLGQTETALFALYPFRPIAGGVSVQVRNQGLNGHLGETLKVGDLKLFTPTEESRLEGELDFHGGTYRVAFKRLPEDATYAANRAPAKQITEHRAEPIPGGWGPDPSEWEGDYELTNAAPDPTEGAAVLAPVIGVAQGLGTVGTTLSEGSMEVAGGEPPTATVELNTGQTRRTYYLSSLAYRGNLRVAKVHEGSPTGRLLGVFEAHRKGDSLRGTLEAGNSRYQVEFERQTR